MSASSVLSFLPSQRSWKRRYALLLSLQLIYLKYIASSFFSGVSKDRRNLRMLGFFPLCSSLLSQLQGERAMLCFLLCRQNIQTKHVFLIWSIENPNRQRLAGCLASLCSSLFCRLEVRGRDTMLCFSLCSSYTSAEYVLFSEALRYQKVVRNWPYVRLSPPCALLPSQICGGKFNVLLLSLRLKYLQYPDSGSLSRA
jgi:hypothetical protein